MPVARTPNGTATSAHPQPTISVGAVAVSSRETTSEEATIETRVTTETTDARMITDSAVQLAV